MRPASLRWLTSIAVALTLVVAGSGAQAKKDKVSGAVCALLTAKEVRANAGIKVGARHAGAIGKFQTCSWMARDRVSAGWASAEWQSGSLDEFTSLYPDGTGLTVGTRPGYFVPGLRALYVGLDGGVLALMMEPGTPEVDVQDALTRLGELAVPRSAALPPPGPYPFAARTDPGGGAFCDLFTPEEIGDILGTEVGAEPAGGESCLWTATATDVWADASAGWADGSLADMRAAWPGGSDLTVDGRAAYLSPGLFAFLFVQVDAGVLELSALVFEETAAPFEVDVEVDDLMTWVGPSGFDVEATLTELGELAVSRSGSMPPPLSTDAAAAMESPRPETG